MAEGGDPARTSSNVTAVSLREKVAYIVGRYEMSKARSSRPMAASLKFSRANGSVSPATVPSVSRDEPLRRTAASQVPTPRAQ